MKQTTARYTLLTIVMLHGVLSFAQKDTLRVMAYNVLYYGNGCQGPNNNYHSYLKTIISFANPDILSLEKVSSIPLSPNDKAATAPAGFADSILVYALNAAFPGRYAYCPFTNAAKANNQCLLYYDTRKLGFAAITSSYTNLTDFNTYKLYYKDPNLSRTHDTTFLYLTLNHDKSGDENAEVRGQQIAGEMEHIRAHFSRLPNMINLGDFNARNSGEPFYQTLTAPKDSNFRFYDPPFFPDHALSYPADWDHNASFGSYLTTSTRETAGEPNSCGSAGGAKNWYDHIFISAAIVDNADHIRYIPHSYKTIGNDSRRYKKGIKEGNASAPAEVIDALYMMSNKYPVMISLEVTPNTGGTSIPHPEIAGVSVFAKEEITITDPVGDRMIIHFPEGMQDIEVVMECIDATGVTQQQNTLKIKGAETSIPCKLPPGEYTVRFTARHNIVSEMKINKQ